MRKEIDKRNSTEGQDVKENRGKSQENNKLYFINKEYINNSVIDEAEDQSRKTTSPSIKDLYNDYESYSKGEPDAFASHFKHKNPMDTDSS